MLKALFRLTLLACACAFMSACAPILAVVGYSTLSPVFQIAVQLDRAKLLGDGFSLVGSGKTISDHALSMVANADCKTVNVITRDPLCKPKAAAVTANAEAAMRAGPAPDERPLPTLSAELGKEHADEEQSGEAPDKSAEQQE